MGDGDADDTFLPRSTEQQDMAAAADEATQAVPAELPTSEAAKPAAQEAAPATAHKAGDDTAMAAAQQALPQIASLLDMSALDTARSSGSGGGRSSDGGGLTPERTSSQVLRPVAQRLTAEASLSEPAKPLSPSQSMPKMSSSASLPLPPSTSLERAGSADGAAAAAAAGPAPAPAAGGGGASPSSSVPPGWQPRKSAWSRYVPQQGSLPAGAQPPGEPPAQQQQAAPASPQAQPLAKSFPAQTSLARFQEATRAQGGSSRFAEEPAGRSASEDMNRILGGGDLAQLAECAAQAQEQQQQQQQAAAAAGERPAEEQLPPGASGGLQSAASALFRRIFDNTAGASTCPETRVSEAPSIGDLIRPEAIAAAADSLVGQPSGNPFNFDTFKGFELPKASSAAAAALHEAAGLLASQASAEHRTSPQGGDGSGGSSQERLSKRNWAEAAAALLGPVEHRSQLSSAFSEALAMRAGAGASLAAASGFAVGPAPPLQMLRPGSTPAESWQNARLMSAASDPSFNIPLSTWRLDSHHQHSGSAPATLGGEMLPKQPQGHAASAGQFKVPESVAARAAAAGLQLQLGSGGSLCMPGTPSITGTQSRATPSPPTTPGSGQDTLSPLGRQLEMCLARQVQLQAAMRHGPLGSFLQPAPPAGQGDQAQQQQHSGSGNDAASVALLAAARNARRLAIGGGVPPVPWPHPSQSSLDSAITRSQLSAAAAERAEHFKVPANFANFLKQASLDSAIALLQAGRDAAPATPNARKLPSGAGAVWPFGAGGLPGPGQPPALPPAGAAAAAGHAAAQAQQQQAAAAGAMGGGLPIEAALPSLGSLGLQGSLRSGLGSLAVADAQLQAASQRIYGDYGGLGASPQLTEAALADSLYRSVARQLQSGAGPAVPPQGTQENVYMQSPSRFGGPQEAGGPYYGMEAAAAEAGGYGDVQTQVSMLELLGLLRAGLASQPQEAPAGGKRKRRADSRTSTPPGYRGGGREPAYSPEPGDGSRVSPASRRAREALDAGGAPAPKRSANNKCEECGTTETPTWRRDGPVLLCNACGLRRKKNPQRLQQQQAAAAVRAAAAAAAEQQHKHVQQHQLHMHAGPPQPWEQPGARHMSDASQEPSMSHHHHHIQHSPSPQPGP